MSIQDKIKEELLKEINGNIDQHYDLLDQRFDLSVEQVNTLVRELNRLKEEIYKLVSNSQLS